MTESADIERLLEVKQISYSLAGKELTIACPFCQSEKRKCYVERATGLFYCFLCGQGGRWKGLAEKLGSSDATIPDRPHMEDDQPDPPPIDPAIVTGNHQRLLTNSCLGVRQYLYNRGLTDSTITKFKLGWDGRNLTIPIFDANGDCMNFKLKRDPTLPSGSKGMFSILGRGRKRLFNEAVLKQTPPPDYVIVCEGEWDCMLLDQYGFPAVTSTGGAQSFDDSWASYFEKISKVYLCFDNDRNQAGQKGLKKTAVLFSKYLQS